MENDLSLIMQSKLFEGFLKSECKIIYSSLQPKLMHFKKNEVIVNGDDLVNFIGIVSSGRVTSAKYDYEGNINLMEIMERPKLICMDIVFTSSRVSPMTIISAEDSSVLVFNYDKLMVQETLPEKYRIQMLNNSIRLLANDNIRKMYKINLLTKKSLRDKILMVLHLFESRRGQSSFDIGMNREQFAQYLCANRSALSHELGVMRKDGLISFNKNIFTICRNINNEKIDK